ncbi:MAG: ATP-dependent zinc metalloprotease FtsH [Phycisphaerae bacterium]|nr:ATP-dependent zinc metalloprotease FtsH [Phycisphaerae bacterium]
MTTTTTMPMLSTPLPGWYPSWARELADLYFSGTTCVFVLHGNVHDLVANAPGEEPAYCNLAEFLANQIFGRWDIVVQYDLGRGLRALAGSDGSRLQPMMQYLAARLGEPGAWPRDPESALLLLDRLIERNLLEDDANRQKRMAIVLDYAQYLTPAADLSTLARNQSANLIRLLSWAQNPYIKRLNMAVILIADKLADLNPRLVQNPYVATLEIPLPDRAAREGFCQSLTPQQDFAQWADFTVGQLAELSAGLNLINLNVVLAQAQRNQQRITEQQFKRLKKELIERQCHGLVEFVEPNYTLDLVVGQDSAKARLQEDARLLLQDHLQAAPMGYLLSGPVGTGKTFLAECYAGSIGIPCIKLRNFRSKYVGETEGNLEQVLNVLRSLGPVMVIIDEADAALGNRSSEGDSGTSSRVFSMIASQMGDTRYRGKILWMLLTCRPDLLPIDLKRQGRAEVHIPLFYPQSAAERQTMFEVMARKNKIAFTGGMVPQFTTDLQLSGADIESVALIAQRLALTAGQTAVSSEYVQQATREFLPSVQGLEKELQELAAVLDCTQLNFLPAHWQEMIRKPNGRAELQQRLTALRQIIEEAG